MDSKTGYQCWEIMNCDNLDCPARHETGISCWEIAQRDDLCHDIAMNCKDCIVYILKAEASAETLHRLKELSGQKAFWESIGSRHQGCMMQAGPSR